MSNVLGIDEVKAKIKAKENVVGLTFVNVRGAQGTVLEGLSSHGKRQAEMTCTTPGCTETHMREQSDWHQSFACRTHNKSKKSGGATSGFTLDDGTVVRFQPLLDSDDDETKQLKGENNVLFTSLKTKKLDEVKAEKAAKSLARKEKLQAEKSDRALKDANERKQKLINNLSKIKEFAASVGVPVSKETLLLAETTDAEDTRVSTSS